MIIILITTTTTTTTTAARQALECLQLLASSCKSNILSSSAVVVLLGECLSRLLQMVMLPTTTAGEYCIASNRIDAFARAFLTLAQLNLTHFHTIATRFIEAQPEHNQALLLGCFERLTTNNHIDMNLDSRKNRQNFVFNMRIFVNEIRPLVTYK